MAVVMREADGKLGAEEKMIALRILLVIYLHDKRYGDALEDIEELLSDPEMWEHREYLLLKREEVRRALTESLNRRKTGFLQFVLDFFQNPAERSVQGLCNPMGDRHAG